MTKNDKTSGSESTLDRNNKRETRTRPYVFRQEIIMMTITLIALAFTLTAMQIVWPLTGREPVWTFPFRVVPFVFFMGAWAVWMRTHTARLKRRAALAHYQLCLKCGYDLSAIESDAENLVTCPECGENNNLVEARTAWRKHLHPGAPDK